MNFNPNISKQAQDNIFSRKIKVTAHSQLAFNNDPVHQTSAQKHVSQIFLDFELNFLQNFEGMLSKNLIRLIKQ